jgi:hypothetical protein
MSYVVRFRRDARHQIVNWHLPDTVMMEVFLRILEELAQDPASKLVRVESPFDGLVYPLYVPDKSNRTYLYAFLFQVRYAKDEETIWIMRGAYDRVSS